MGWINRRTVPQLNSSTVSNPALPLHETLNRRCYYALVAAAGCIAPSASSADAASCREAAQVVGGLEAASGCVERLEQSRERTRRFTESEKSRSN
jgi:hypothetical protein